MQVTFIHFPLFPLGLFVCLWSSLQAGLCFSTQLSCWPLSKASFGLPRTTSSVVHHPPMSHLLHTSEFQLAPACQATCFLRDKTTFTVNLKDNLCSLCGISLTYYSIWWKIRNIWLQILSTADIKMCYYCANTGKEELESKRCQCGLRQHQASFKNHCALKIRAQMYTACTCTVHALFKFCSCTIRALLFV